MNERITIRVNLPLELVRWMDQQRLLADEKLTESELVEVGLELVREKWALENKRCRVVARSDYRGACGTDTTSGKQGRTTRGRARRGEGGGRVLINETLEEAQGPRGAPRGPGPYQILLEAYQDLTFGNSEPMEIRMGIDAYTWFHEISGRVRPLSFCGAKVVLSASLGPKFALVKVNGPAPEIDRPIIWQDRLVELPLPERRG